MGAGDNLIESTARALLRERIEATPWFQIRMSQEQRRAAIEREVDTYWHLFRCGCGRAAAWTWQSEPAREALA
jgi:hypothetical protein